MGKENFDTIMKDRLASFEADYDSNLWNAIENRLDKQDRVKKIKKLGLLCGSILLLGYVFSTLYTKENEVTTGQKNENESKETVSNYSINPRHPDKGKVNILISDNKTENGIKEETKVILSNEDNSTQNTTLTDHSVIRKDSLKPETVKEKAEEKTTNSSIKEQIEPLLKFSSNKSEACENEIIKFEVANQIPDFKYRWNFGDGNVAEGAQAEHKYEVSGVYSVSLSVISQSNANFLNVIKDMITIYEAPSSQFEWQANPENVSTNVTMAFSSPEAEDIKTKWSFGDGNTSNISNPNHIYSKRGIYNVTLEKRSSKNCSSTTTKQVVVNNDYNLLAPDAFSPNGDGRNDTWYPVAIRNSDLIFSLSILDKSGKLVFTTTDKNFEWNGWLQDKGKIADFGETFVWIAKVQDTSNSEQEYSGTITIVR